ncbi:MAG: hotdog domain-containing protein [Deltaproteobacteria bacterium]
MKSRLRLRVPNSEAHYGGNLVSGSKILEYFGDVATELLIQLDGDEGLFRAYDNIEFLAPVFGGDYLEIEGEITEIGNTSRKMVFTASKVIEPEPSVAPSAARVLKTPVVVVKASGTCVTPKNLQRNPQ